MKIAVIGAGAMGSLFGGLLAESGADVCLLDVWREHVDTLNRVGLCIEREDAQRTIPVTAATDPQQVGKADLVIVFVKSTHTRQAAATAARIAGDHGRVLTLQNGMGNADILAEAINPQNVLAGTTSHGATLLGPGNIKHAGMGPTTIGPWSGGSPDTAQNVADLFSRAGIETQVADDVRSLIWGKLLVNVGINAITALTDIKNGQINDLEITRNLSRSAVEEAMQVARAQGITVRDDAVEHVFQLAQATSANRSSMGQDVDNRRQTEISAINGAVVNEARKVGLAAPVNETLSALIETLQKNYA
jgi:2-dehydropantoate 2-reductase